MIAVGSASVYGLLDNRSVLRVCDLMIILGADFERQARYRPIVRILGKTGMSAERRFASAERLLSAVHGSA